MLTLSDPPHLLTDALLDRVLAGDEDARFELDVILHTIELAQRNASLGLTHTVVSDIPI